MTFLSLLLLQRQKHNALLAYNTQQQQQQQPGAGIVLHTHCKHIFALTTSAILASCGQLAHNLFFYFILFSSAVAAAAPLN